MAKMTDPGQTECTDSVEHVLEDRPEVVAKGTEFTTVLEPLAQSESTATVEILGEISSSSAIPSSIPVINVTAQGMDTSTRMTIVAVM